jgi:hypothetical protein
MMCVDEGEAARTISSAVAACSTTCARASKAKNAARIEETASENVEPGKIGPRDPQSGMGNGTQKPRRADHRKEADSIRITATTRRCNTTTNPHQSSSPLGQPRPSVASSLILLLRAWCQVRRTQSSLTALQYGPSVLLKVSRCCHRLHCAALRYASS